MRDLRLILAEARPVRRQRLAALLRSRPGLLLTAAPATLAEACAQAEAAVPDAVLLCADYRRQAEVSVLSDLARALGFRLLPLPDTDAEPDLSRLLADLAGSPTPPLAPAQPAVILVGASTGGVEALHRMLGAFPADCPPTLVVQHMRGAFTAAFAEGLDRACRPRVAEAADGTALAAGRILVAPGDAAHLTVEGSPPACRLRTAPPLGGHRPAVDALFRSAVPLGGRVVAVLLTGMGRDGAEGMLAIRAAGGHTIAQDRASSTVFGMPRVAAELGAACQVLPLERIAEAALRAAGARLAQPAGGAP